MNQIVYTFECALSTHITHYCVNAVQLTCGHYVCATCLKSLRNLIEFGCKHCGKAHKLAKYKTAGTFSNKTNLDELFESTLNQYKIILDKIKDCENIIENRIEYIFDEIDVRVESLKIELDNLRDSLKNDFLLIRDNLSDKLCIKRIEAEDELAQIEAILKDKSKQTAQSLDNYQNKIKETRELIDSVNKEVTFLINEMPVSATLIGTKTTKGSLQTYLETKSYQNVELEMNLSDLQVLPNNRLLILFPRRIRIYDKHFNLLNTYNTELAHVNSRICAENCLTKDFVAYVTTNKRNRIYLVYPFGGKVVMTDLNLNELQTYPANNTSNHTTHLHPTCIDFYQNHLYVGDGIANQIVELTEDLKLNATYPLHSKSLIIKIATNGVACIECCNKTFSFYDVKNSFMLLYKFIKTYKISGISVWNDEFYLYEEDTGTVSTQKIICYTNAGQLKNELKITKPYDFYNFSSITEFNGTLLNSFVFNRNLSVDNDQNFDDDDDDDDDNDIGLFPHNLPDHERLLNLMRLIQEPTSDIDDDITDL